MSRARNERRKLLFKLKDRYGFVTKFDPVKETAKLLTGVSELDKEKKVKLLEYIKIRRSVDPGFKEYTNKLAELIKSKQNESTDNS